MEINLEEIKRLQMKRPTSIRSDHSSEERTTPSFWQYDYPVLKALALDIGDMMRIARKRIRSDSPRVLDIGCNTSPYRCQLEDLGFSVQTMDLDLNHGADLAGSVEATDLADSSFDLIICTQVLEHCSKPWLAAPELFRILAPGGCLIASAPHAWFYHPHPDDNWRFTPEGLSRLLCDNGFESISLRVQGGSVSSVFQILNFCLFGLIGRFGTPIFAMSNLVGSFLDRLFFNPLFAINVALLAGKPLKP